jgi:hypothetical protein
VQQLKAQWGSSSLTALHLVIRSGDHSFLALLQAKRSCASDFIADPIQNELGAASTMVEHLIMDVVDETTLVVFIKLTMESVAILLR